MNTLETAVKFAIEDIRKFDDANPHREILESQWPQIESIILNHLAPIKQEVERKDALLKEAEPLVQSYLDMAISQKGIAEATSWLGKVRG